MRKLFKLLLLGAGLYIFAALALAAWGLSEDVFAADALVVPGNTVYPDGRPSDRLAARLDRALELYRAGFGKFVIVSGGIGKEGVDEALAMRDYLIRKGVPEKDLIADFQGYTTRATARFTAAWLKERSLTSALAVSQYFHTPRAALALERAGVGKVGRAYASFVEWRDIYSITRELPAWLYYNLAPR